jgi:ABC-type transport system involved in cytochrome c biogenesis permease component
MSKTSDVPSGVTGATLAKDLRLEWRSKDAINSMLFFSLLVVVVFSFSFDPNAGRVAPDRRRTV